MAPHKLNPVPEEVWYHPDTLNQYRIHSLTDDGWVRYYAPHDRTGKCGGPLYTEPTLTFISKYRRGATQ
jgi:hypothetical protein